jgi:hypothetical protein
MPTNSPIPPPHDQDHRLPRRRRRPGLRLTLLAAAGALILVVGVIVTLTIRGPTSGATQTNCASSPASCGFPSAATAGVPSGLTLKRVPGQVSKGPGWHFDSRGWVEVDGDGAVLDGLYIPYNLDITASNVTIKDVKVVNGGQSAFGISLRHTHNVTIVNSTITGINRTTGRVLAGVKDIYGDSTGTTVLRDNIRLFESGVQMDEGLVQDSYIHEPGYIDGDHTNGVTANGGTTLLTVNHNTILIHRTQTDAVGLFEDFGAQANRTITDNLLAGGGYTIYGGQNNGGPPTSNIVVSGNQISPIYYPRGGFFGWVANFDSSGVGNLWQNNVWDNNGQIIPSP